MIYQIYYDQDSFGGINLSNDVIIPFGVHNAKSLKRQNCHLYDDQKSPNLTEHNTLCEWRVLYYIWKHYPSPWIGFTSWQHDRKRFTPVTNSISRMLCDSALNHHNIVGFCIYPLKSLIAPTIAKHTKITLKAQFAQWHIAEDILGYKIPDNRNMAMCKYHDVTYWNFVIDEYRNLYGVNLEKDLDFISLGSIDKLHTWSNAFIAKWEYFNEYMTVFSPIVLSMLDHFGSHPKDLELSYICERLIILHNYIKYTNNEFSKMDCKENGSVCKNAIINTAQSNHHCEFSIVTCSADNAKFHRLKENVISIFGSRAQLVRINDASSIAEGYNRGVKKATGDIVIFCHDDVTFMHSEIPSYIKEDLETNDIVGIAGTSRLTEGKWTSCGPPHVHGHVMHKAKGRNGYILCIYGLGRDDTIVSNIQALDGLFFAAKRDVVEKLIFDENVFDGFHLYDLDFTYSAYLKGFRLVIDHRLFLLHDSVGNYDCEWKRYVERFDRKYSNYFKIQKAPTQRYLLTRGICSDNVDALKMEMHKNSKSQRLFIKKQDGNDNETVDIIIQGEQWAQFSLILKDLKIPLESNTINFINFKCNSISETDKDYLIPEMYRISRHGAVIEVNIDPSNGTESQHEKRNTCQIIDLCRWVQNYRFINEDNNNGAIKLMGAPNEAALSEKAYFQINKKAFC
jgi:hypothetical protein